VLQKTERLALGLIVWHHPPKGPPEKDGDVQNQPDNDDPDDEDDDEAQSDETGDLMVAIFDEATRDYRLQKVLQLGGAR
jgi:hypothetical protein